MDAPSLTPNQRAWRRFSKNPAAFTSACVLGVLTVLLFLHPLISTQSPTTLTDALANPPSSQHWFGTDLLGRDLLSRLVYGARISMMVGLVGAGVSLLIGVLWGAVAGYIGGTCDGVMMRIVDILYSLPSVIFVIVMITSLEGLFKDWLLLHFSPEAAGVARLLFLFAGLGAVSWLTMARIVRGEVLSLRTRSFVDASRAMGASHIHILRKHILPNVAGVVIVYLTLTIPSVILYESFLSYLGLGIQAPQASLGSLMAEGSAQINSLRLYWWMVLFPGLLLVVMLLTLNFIGDGLRDAFDPRSEKL